jgi:hypothetical protein
LHPGALRKLASGEVHCDACGRRAFAGDPLSPPAPLPESERPDLDAELEAFVARRWRALDAELAGQRPVPTPRRCP